jgi:predicted O-methyltransferase YrrM
MTNLANKFVNTKILKNLEEDTVLCDTSFESHCGYMSYKEIDLLENTVSKIKGKWLEIGSHTGWSGAHIAKNCNEVYLVDPQYNLEKFRERTIDNLKNAEVFDKCKLFSTDKFFDTNREFFDGIVIDGNHDAPYPLLDAISADKFVNVGGYIFFHDYNGQPIKDGVNYLKQKGYEVETHNTINGIAICRKVSV